MTPRIIPALLATLALLSGCGRDLSSSTYTSSSTGGKVLQGTIISARHVTVKDTERLQDNAVGGLAGGVAGGVGGSAIGKGKGSTGAAVGGAIAGAVIGAMIQDALSTSEGIEYLVKLDGKHANKSKTTKKRSKITHGNVSVEDDMKSDIETETQTDMISVVQQDEIPLTEGERVYIIYSDDRPRVVAMNK